MTIKTKIKFTLIFSALFFVFSATSSFASSDIISPREIILLTNKSRTENNIAPLVPNEKLRLAAEEKAFDMIQHNYFAHTSPSGVTPWHWIRNNKYDYKYAGENLAINYTDAGSQHAAWMNSESHRQNILDSNFSETGAAVIDGTIDGKTALISVQIFASPKNPAAVSSSNIFSMGLAGSLVPLKNYPDSGYENIASKNKTDLKFQGEIYPEKIKEKSYVLSSKNINFDLKNYILILSLISLTIIVHANILSSLNPRKIHHISTINILVLMIIFSALF